MSQKYFCARDPVSGRHGRFQAAGLGKSPETAVQHHEYLCAELRRMREEYEQEFAQERAILRTLRQRWIERVCDDQVRGEDALRYLVETARSVTKKSDPPPTSGT